MDKNFIFKRGKFAGKTYGWVEDNASWYIKWLKVNAPNLLIEDKPKIETKDINYIDIPLKTMSPNENFWNEGPDEKSKPYLEQMKLKNKENEK